MYLTTLTKVMLTPPLKLIESLWWGCVLVLRTKSVARPLLRCRALLHIQNVSNLELIVMHMFLHEIEIDCNVFHFRVISGIAGEMCSTEIIIENHERGWYLNAQFMQKRWKPLKFCSRLCDAPEFGFGAWVSYHMLFSRSPWDQGVSKINHEAGLTTAVGGVSTLIHITESGQSKRVKFAHTNSMCLCPRQIPQNTF